ncbi:MAG: hypothetical protein Tsb0015_00680 [Simkaniaceae bacterium]
MRLPGNIPLSISPFFWLVAALIGFVYTQNFIGTLIWIAIIFISVLFHEYGHALTSLFFGQRPRIALVPFGGVTYPEGPRIKLWKEFLVVFNGPLFGFILYLLATLLLQIPVLNQPILFQSIKSLQLINLFWTILNLLPIMPMDGGHLLRIVLESFFGVKGLKYTLMTSLVISLVFSLAFFLVGAFLVGAIFFLFAYQNFETWRRMRNIAESDRRDDLRETLAEAEAALKKGRLQEAVSLLEDVRKKAKSGIIFQMATDTLAKVFFEMEEPQKSYELLKSVEKNLDIDSKLILHETAFEMEDWQRVKNLAAECFQNEPSKELALRTSMACAQLREPVAAVGWLEAAVKQGLENMEEIVSDDRFDPIRDSEAFQKFLSAENL